MNTRMDDELLSLIIQYGVLNNEAGRNFTLKDKRAHYAGKQDALLSQIEKLLILGESDEHIVIALNQTLQTLSESISYTQNIKEREDIFKTIRDISNQIVKTVEKLSLD